MTIEPTPTTFGTKQHRVCKLILDCAGHNEILITWILHPAEVTWENPLVGAAEPSTSASLPPEPSTSSSADVYGGIDPDLAYLDPSLSRSTTSISATPAFQARFNARTGRFQGDPTMNPDRISEFKRGERQQGAYYDVDGWNESLAGRGIRGADEDERGGKKRKVTAKDVVRNFLFLFIAHIDLILFLFYERLRRSSRRKSWRRRRRHCRG